MSVVTKEEAMKRLVRFAFSDDDGDPDLSLLPEFAAAMRKAEQRGAERERAAVTAWLYQELGDGADQLAIDINLGKHVKVAP